MPPQCIAELVGGSNRVLTDAFVASVGKECVELQPQQPPLCQQRAVLLDDGEKMRQQTGLCHDSLSEQRAAFRAADVEYVAQLGKIVERHVVFGARQRIGQARAVQIQRDAILMTRGAYGGELCARIERAVFGGVGNIYHARHDRMVAGCVAQISVQARLDLRGGDLAVLVRQCQHLVAAKFNGAGLVHGDVSGIRCNDALIALQQRVDHGRVRLRTAHQKEDICVRRAAGCADLRPRGVTVFIQTVARRFKIIRFRQPLKNRRMRALHVIGCKG